MNKILVGHIGVDAGLCWIGDPCYILHKETPPKEIGKNWIEFCNSIFSGENHKSFNYDGGHEGLGVCVSTGYGDGFYPVYAYIKDDRVLKVEVDFGTEEGEQFMCESCGMNEVDHEGNICLDCDNEEDDNA